MAKCTARQDDTAANLGYEAQLWQMADALRGSMDAAEYKHVCLGLLFLKYISDAFEEKHAALLAEKAQGADPEDPDEYRAQSIFWVPKEARWQHLKASSPQSTIGTLVDDAMAAIERDNPSLKGVLPKDYARPGLDKQRLGQIIKLVSDIALGDPAERARDTVGPVYESLLPCVAKRNLEMRGMDALIAHGDAFRADRHPDLKVDYLLANPPLNESDWRGELLKNDQRWAYGTPPAGNANYAWVQHFIQHLAPTEFAGFVLANGSMSSNQSSEGEIRNPIIEGDLVDCMVALPS